MKDTVTLESILTSLAYKVEWCVNPELLSGATVDRDIEDEAINEAKQALTSLIKELVAEAKPDKLKESDYTLNMRVPHNPPSNTTRTNLYRKGYNDSLDQFEYNLLKALEEK